MGHEKLVADPVCRESEYPDVGSRSDVNYYYCCFFFYRSASRWNPFGQMGIKEYSWPGLYRSYRLRTYYPGIDAIRVWTQYGRYCGSRIIVWHRFWNL